MAGVFNFFYLVIVLIPIKDKELSNHKKLSWYQILGLNFAL